jgi:hypothetical protein
MNDLEKYIAECEANAVPDSEIDTSEIPEVTDFSHFYPRHGESARQEPCIKLSLSINRSDFDAVRTFAEKSGTDYKSVILDAVNYYVKVRPGVLRLNAQAEPAHST